MTKGEEKGSLHEEKEEGENRKAKVTCDFLEVVVQLWSEPE